MTRWDAARAKSQQPARKYKACGPVGERQPLTPTQVIDMRFTALPRAHGGGCDLIACSGCGHLQCSCKPKSVGQTLVEAVENLRASALRIGRPLSGQVRLFKYHYQRIGSGSACIDMQGDVVVACHPHDAAEVERAFEVKP